MRHRVGGYKLGRKSAHRRAMWRNMAVSLFTHGQITTTIPKAKSLRPMIEKIITTARKGDLTSRRRVIKALRDPIIVANDQDVDVKRNKYGELVSGPRLVKKLFDEIAPRFANRPGGYTRIIKLSRNRIGDGADLCVLQLVGEKDSRPKPAGGNRRKKADRRQEFAAKARKAEAAAPAAETKAE